MRGPDISHRINIQKAEASGLARQSKRRKLDGKKYHADKLALSSAKYERVNMIDFLIVAGIFAGIFIFFFIIL